MIPTQADFDHAKKMSEIAAAQPVRVLAGGPGLGTIIIGVAIGVFIGMIAWSAVTYTYAKMTIENSTSRSVGR